jgi:hypothetical protein
MLVLCYHNGALGHTTSALIECCTKEGGFREFPSFVMQKNLHHFKKSTSLYRISHPDCDVVGEKLKGNIVISSTSYTVFGRLLIILMGFEKWIGALPDENRSVMFNQFGNSYAEQVEILAKTLLDTVKFNDEWFMNANYKLDILDFWENTDNVVGFLSSCGLTPDKQLTEKFCNLVAKTNDIYFKKIKNCVNVADCVINNIEKDISLSFYETAMVLVILMDHYKITDMNLLKNKPNNTRDFFNIIKENNG